MSFIPKKIRLLPLSVALITTISLGTSAFASPTYTATTTYVGNSTVSVTAKISDAVSGEQVTFLVANDTASPTSDDIVYIDQDVIGSDQSKTFTFTSSKTDMLLTTTKIKFGTASASATSIAGSSTTSTVDSNNFVNFDLLGVPRVMSDPNYVSKSGVAATGTEAELSNNCIVTFGRITGSLDGATYGILWSESDSASNGIAQTFTPEQINGFSPSTGTIRKYPALATSEIGQFAIKLVDGGQGKIRTTKTFYTRTYAIYNNGVTSVVSLGDVRTVGL